MLPSSMPLASGRTSAAPAFAGPAVTAASAVAVRDFAAAGTDAFAVPKAVGFTLTGVAGGPSGSRGAFGSSANGGRAAIVFLPDGTSTGGLVTLTQ